MPKNIFLISKKEGIKYARLSGDSNKIHINFNYGYNSIFGKNICHGTLVISTFLKKIKFNHKNNYYIDKNFKNPFYYKHKIFIKKKEINKKNIKYSLIQNKKEKAIIIFNLSQNFSYDIERATTKKKFVKKIYDNKIEIETVLNSLSMYVGTIYPGDKSLISKIKIFYNKEKKVDRRKKNILSIHSKLLEKGYPIINNYLKFNSYDVYFESLMRPDIKKNNIIIPQFLKSIANKIKYNVLIIGASQGIGKYIFDIIKNNKKIIKIATYNKNILKSSSKKIIVKKLDIFKEKKVINKLIEKYSPIKIYYFPTTKIFFDNSLSNHIIKEYKKIYIDIPLKILKDNKHEKITFFYPSTTNIEVNKNSAYSKIKLIAEKKIKKICSQFKIKHFIYRFPAIYSRQSVSLINVNPPNLIKHINSNKKITKILF